MQLYWMKKVEVFNKCVKTMENISQQRAKNWVVVFESEPRTGWFNEKSGGNENSATQTGNNSVWQSSTTSRF